MQNDPGDFKLILAIDCKRERERERRLFCALSTNLRSKPTKDSNKLSELNAKFVLFREICFEKKSQKIKT